MVGLVTGWLSSHIVRSVIVGLVLLGTPELSSAQTDPCSVSLQSLVDSASSGGILLLSACIYRETVTITKPLTLNGQNRAEIRGSDVWSNWSPNGVGWLSAQAYPNIGDDSITGTAPCDQSGPCYIDYFSAFNLEQVFYDGTPLKHVPSTPGPGQFSLDGARRVQIGSNPSGHTLEVSVRKRWANSYSDGITYTDLVFRHAATAAFEAAISSDAHKNWTLQNSTISDAHGGMIGTGGAGNTNNRILGNKISNAGDVAIGGYQGSGTVIQGNTITHTGYGGWDPNWQAGAVKIVAQSNAILDGNVVADAYGMGLWCDISCSNVTFSNNKVHDVGDVGIHYEISTGCHIYNNAVWNSGARQNAPSIYVSNSGGCEIDQNVVYNAPGNALFMGYWNRPTPPLDSNYFHDNYAIMTKDAGFKALGFEADTAVATITNSQHGAANAFWYPVPEGGLNRYSWDGTYTASLSAFNATPGGGGNSYYLTTAQKDGVLQRAGILGVTPTLTPTPTATPVPTVTPTATPKATPPGWDRGHKKRTPTPG